MATFNATFSRIYNRVGLAGAEHTVPLGRNAQGCSPLATSGSVQTVQRGGAAWTMPADGVVTCHCDGVVRVAVGEDPANGSSPVGHRIPAGVMYSLSVAAGEDIRVIDAT